MAVVIETTLGDITVDLYLDQRPVTCLNFLKLCKMKYYNYNLFHSIRSGFIAQTGDPTGEGSGGQSIFGVLEGPSKRFFSGEKMPKIRHTNAGLLSMVCTGDMMVGSQFFFTLAPDLDSLDGVHCVIGEVTEGHDVLRKLNEVICDDTHRPYQDVRITHTVILEDPFNDPTGFRAPSRSPSPSAERLKGGRIAPDEEIDETQGKSVEEVQEMIEEKEAKARATILEIVGDLPDADIAPPENVLFVCKLNPVTSDEDLEIIFSRFGKIVSCEVIRDKKTGDSLQYAFIEFSDKKSCEDAYFKMDNVLIDDRRIHVDFSQSVSKMRYLGKGRGVKYLDENDTDYKTNHVNNKSGSSKNKDKVKTSNSNRNHDKERNHVNKRNEYENNINNKEKRHKSIRDSNNHRDRSRSRSQSRRNRSRDRKHENSNSQHNTKHSEQSTNNEHNHKQKEHNSNSRHLKARHSPQRKKSYSPERRHRDNYKSHQEDKPVSEKHSRKDKTGSSSRDIRENRDFQDNESRKRTPKRKREDSEPLRENKKIKKRDHSDKERKVIPRTPTPVEKKSSVKKDKVKAKQRKEEKVTKKRRKYSTSSSDSDSSDSSSTSETSTSSEDRKKRRRPRKRRRRHSSSSSSSDSTESSSSTSSSSESSSSSSSSDSEPRRKKRSRKVSHRKSKRK